MHRCKYNLNSSQFLGTNLRDMDLQIKKAKMNLYLFTRLPQRGSE